MKNPVYFLRSWLGVLNFFLLQWFFVRRVQVWTNSETDSRYLGAYLDVGIVPLTGWWSDYVRVSKRRKIPQRIRIREYAITGATMAVELDAADAKTPVPRRVD